MGHGQRRLAAEAAFGFGGSVADGGIGTLNRFTAFQGSLLRGGSALGNVVSAQVTYANNLDCIEVLRGDGLIDGLDPSRASLTGTIDVHFDNQTLLTDAINGAPTELQFVYQISASQLFRLAGGARRHRRAHVHRRPDQ